MSRCFFSFDPCCVSCRHSRQGVGRLRAYPFGNAAFGAVPPAGNPNPPEAPYQANFKEGAGETTHFTSCEPYPTPPAAAQPSIEPPRQTSIMAPDSAPAQADWAASKGPFFSDRRLWPSGSRAQPWSLFAFFLSTQKEGPRRPGARRDALKITIKAQKGPSPKKPKNKIRKACPFKKTPAHRIGRRAGRGFRPVGGKGASPLRSPVPLSAVPTRHPPPQDRRRCTSPPAPPPRPWGRRSTRR